MLPEVQLNEWPLLFPAPEATVLSLLSSFQTFLDISKHATNDSGLVLCQVFSSSGDMSVNLPSWCSQGLKEIYLNEKIRKSFLEGVLEFSAVE